MTTSWFRPPPIATNLVESRGSEQAPNIGVLGIGPAVHDVAPFCRTSLVTGEYQPPRMKVSPEDIVTEEAYIRGWLRLEWLCQDVVMVMQVRAKAGSWCRPFPPQTTTCFVPGNTNALWPQRALGRSLIWIVEDSTELVAPTSVSPPRTTKSVMLHGVSDGVLIPVEVVVIVVDVVVVNVVVCDVVVVDVVVVDGVVVDVVVVVDVFLMDFKQWQQSDFCATIWPQSPFFSPADRSYSVARCWKSTSVEKSTHVPWPSKAREHPSSMQVGKVVVVCSSIFLQHAQELLYGEFKVKEHDR